MRCIHLFVSTFAIVSALTLTGCEPAAEAGSASADSGPSDRTSFTAAGEIQDVSYAGVKRFSKRIVVPLGRTREEVTETLEIAARELAKEQEADAVMVFAYRPDDSVEGAYTVGRAVYAPNGKWEDAEGRGPMRVVVDLNELYFAPSKTYSSPGDTITLGSSAGEEVPLSNAYGDWSDKAIVARLATGTRAIILEKKSEPMGEQEFVRYRVRVLGTGSREGWIHEWNVSQ